MPDIRCRVATESDFLAVRQCMAEVFEETAGQKTGEFGEALWRWQYAENPTGSIVVMAEDGEVVCGYYHVLLFPLRLSERRIVGAMVQDVGTRREYRKHGIFKRMGAFAMERVRSAGASLIYTFPNHLSLPSFVRNHGYTVVAQAPVRVMPLRTGPLLGGRFKLGAFGRGLGTLVDPVLKLMTRNEPLGPGERLQSLERFTEAVIPLVDGATQQTEVTLDRTVEYLNWRFRAKPTVRYDIWSLVRDEVTEAYLVTRRATTLGTECVLFMDFGFRQGATHSLLRLASARLAAERKEGTALAVTMGLHPAFGALESLGFRRVPERFNPRTFNLLVKDLEEAVRPALFLASNWMVTLADWDVF